MEAFTKCNYWVVTQIKQDCFEIPKLVMTTKKYIFETLKSVSKHYIVNLTFNYFDKPMFYLKNQNGE